MKKKILSQLMILSFAFAGLFLINKNINAQISDLDPIGRYCTWGRAYSDDPSSVAVLCSDCIPQFGYVGIGNSGTCF
jgi:hypothetical protein